MTTLAFILVIITAGPSELVGTEWESVEPIVCDLRAINAEAEKHGLEVDIYCTYTAAPITSIRPEARP